MAESAWWPQYPDESHQRDDWPISPDVPEVEDTPNPVVARLLGPDGTPLVDVLERPCLPLGYHPGPREPSRVVRHY